MQNPGSWCKVTPGWCIGVQYSLKVILTLNSGTMISFYFSRAWGICERTNTFNTLQQNRIASQLYKSILMLEFWSKSLVGLVEYHSFWIKFSLPSLYMIYNLIFNFHIWFSIVSWFILFLLKPSLNICFSWFNIGSMYENSYPRGHTG